jgi:nucleoid-associated protein YgaU
MGLFNFFGSTSNKLAGQDNSSVGGMMDDMKSNLLSESINGMGLGIQNLNIQVSGDKITVSGDAPSQDAREKAIVALGNTSGIVSVDDNITIASASADQVGGQGQFHVVEKGDTLSGIAKQFYGNAMKYPVIFEANKPMLSDPDRIYPGQTLRIPPIDGMA